MKQDFDNMRKSLQKEEKRNTNLTQEIIDSRTLVSTLKVSVNQSFISYLPSHLFKYINKSVLIA